MNTKQSIAPEVDAAIRQTITDAMSAYDIERIDIHAEEEDYAGYPSILVLVRYRLNETPFEPTVTLELNKVLRIAVRQLGEDRFVFLRHEFDDRQPIAKRRRRSAA
jgi:hypothetical protein